MKNITEYPDNWVSARIDQMVIATGLFQDGDWVESKDQDPNGDVRLIQLADIGVLSFKDKSSRFLTSDKAEELKCKFLEPGDILVARLPKPLGRACIFPLKGKYVTVVDVAIIRIDNKVVSSKWLTYIINSPQINSTILGYATGTTRQRISRRNLAKISFPLPPLPEQHRIVAKLDALMARVAVLEAGLARIPQLLADFRQSVLSKAVTGELTREWREGKELEAVEIDNVENKEQYSLIEFPDLESSWTIAALGNYAECSRGKFTARPRNDPKYFSGTYPFMQIGDLPRNGGYTSQYSKTLNEKGISVSKSFPRNTVVIAIVGATIGNTGILTREMYFPDSLIGINTSNAISNYYVEYFLRVVKNGLREISYAGGGQPNIKIPTIKNLLISLPSIEEQAEIVRRVESLFAQADAIEERYAALKQKVETLPQAILAKAFRGELVPQLPEDGDARELLAEIRGMREEGIVKSKKKRK